MPLSAKTLLASTSSQCSVLWQPLPRAEASPQEHVVGQRPQCMVMASASHDDPDGVEPWLGGSLQHCPLCESPLLILTVHPVKASCPAQAFDLHIGVHCHPSPWENALFLCHLSWASRNMGPLGLSVPQNHGSSERLLELVHLHRVLLCKHTLFTQGFQFTILQPWPPKC
jgi:hypothetical protein